MSTIVTRAGKGSALSWTEADANFTNLNTDKSEADRAETLTNKTVDLTDNSLSGTTAEFNTALSDGDFATLAGTETLENKTIDTANNTITVLTSDVTGLDNTLNTSSIANLRLIDGTGDNPTKVFVDGYTSSGDGGGGEFYWDATSTETDNGGTIIKATAITTGRWKRKLEGPVNAMWFGTNTATLYVSTTGSDSNHGFSSGQAVATLQQALDNIESLGTIFEGSWVVELAAGTYQESGAVVAAGLVFENRLTIKGPSVSGHPNVPTAILDGSTGTTGQHAITFTVRGYGTVQDIKAINFTHADSNTGCFLAQNGADVLFDNCHATGASWFGVYVTASSKGRVKGGIFDGCRENIAFNASEGTVGYQAGSLAGGPIVKNATEKGVLWSRGSQGHVDYTTLDANTIGLVSDRNSRAADVECDFKNNGTAIQTRSGGVVSGDKDNTYNIGTGSANTVLFDFGAYSGPTEEILDRTGVGPSVDARSELLVARDLTNHAHTGDTVRTVVATPYTLVAGYFIDGGTGSLIGPKLRIRATGSRTNGGTPGTAQIGIQLGGSSISQWSMYGTTADDWILEVEIWSQGSASQKVHGTLMHGSGGSLRNLGAFSRAIDMTSNRDVQLDLQLGDAGDTLTIETIEVWRQG